jgi:heterodisulfide reductase subunit A-like polyferredoxin
LIDLEHFPKNDPNAEMIQNRCKKNLCIFLKSFLAKPLIIAPEKLKNTKYDALVVGAGHNGLIADTYLAKKGKKVAVIEKQHLIGGAAVT